MALPFATAASRVRTGPRLVRGIQTPRGGAGSWPGSGRLGHRHRDAGGDSRTFRVWIRANGGQQVLVAALRHQNPLQPGVCSLGSCPFTWHVLRMATGSPWRSAEVCRASVRQSAQPFRCSRSSELDHSE